MSKTIGTVVDSRTFHTLRRKKFSRKMVDCSYHYEFDLTDNAYMYRGEPLYVLYFLYDCKGEEYRYHANVHAEAAKNCVELLATKELGGDFVVFVGIHDKEGDQVYLDFDNPVWVSGGEPNWLDADDADSVYEQFVMEHLV